eukprot:1354255-Pyramimonas_sp.AAC.1
MGRSGGPSRCSRENRGSMDLASSSLPQPRPVNAQTSGGRSAQVGDCCVEFPADPALGQGGERKLIAPRGTRKTM